MNSRGIVFILLLSQLGLANCAAIMHVQTYQIVLDRTEIRRETRTSRDKEKYAMTPRIQGSALFLSARGSWRQNEEERIWYRQKTRKGKRIRDPKSGDYYFRLWSLFERTDKKKAPFFMGPLFNFILAIPSLGTSLVIMTLDYLTLPLRMITYDRRVDEFDMYDRNVRRTDRTLSTSGARVECAGRSYLFVDGEARIPLRAVLPERWRSALHCTLFDADRRRVTQQPFYLYRMIDESERVRAYLNRHRRAILTELLATIRLGRESQFRNKDRVISDYAAQRADILLGSLISDRSVDKKVVAEGRALLDPVRTDRATATPDELIQAILAALAN